MIKFLVNGLLRDRQRSLIPILVVAIGVCITVFFHAYIRGVFGEMIDSTARFRTGHVKVMSWAYAENADQKPNDLALLGVDQITADLQQQYPEMTWVQRIQFGGLLDIPDVNGETRSQGPVFGMGVDLLSPRSSEVELLNIEKALVNGRLPQNSGEILISDELARRLEVKLGEAATLLTSTMYASMAMYNFTVVGTIRFGFLVMDRGAMNVDLADIQQAMDMEDAAGEILGYMGNRIYDDESAAIIVEQFNAKRSAVNDAFAPVMGKLKELSDLSDYLAMVEYMGLVLVVVFVFIMSIVLWNVGLLGGLRRYGEVGLRLAIGEHKSQVYRSMIYESIFVGLTGSVIGTGLGLGAAYWLQIWGWDISSMIKNVTMMYPSVIRAEITSETYYIGFFPGLLSTVFGTALSGIGIYKRQTAQLFKELEV
jgi:putative ABC transport system permease protein